MAQVHLSGVTHAYAGYPTPSVVDLDLVIEDGEFLSILGPSGAGKTTVLRLLSGLEKPRVGEILLDGEDVTAQPPNIRHVATIGKNHPLYPHMTVAQNICFPLVNARLANVTGTLELSRLLDRYPRSLKPAELNAVYLARAMIQPIGVLLLDEPFVGLDHDDRRQARVQLGTLQRRTRTTTVYVTQDQTEAMTLSDRIAVIAGGRLQQVVKPLDLYHNPASLAVAQFFGNRPMNTLTATVADGSAHVADLVIPLPERVQRRGFRSLVVGVRSEEVHLLPRGAAITVRYVDHTGSEAFVHGWLGSGDSRQEIVVRCPGRSAPRLGETVYIDVLKDDHVLFFDVVTGQRL